MIKVASARQLGECGDMIAIASTILVSTATSTRVTLPKRSITFSCSRRSGEVVRDIAEFAAHDIGA